MKTLTQLDKWNKDIEQLTDMAENASSAKLFKYYRGALIDIKKQMKAYIDDYDSLSFAKRLEADRLISVGAQIDKTLKETYGNAKGEIVDHSTISAENGYYGTWYALEGNENVQLDMAFLDKKYIHQLIYKEVAGATFSARLYKERDKLAAATKQALLNATRDGKGYGHAAKAVEEATEASYKQALRIMRTEGGRARSEATQKSYVNAEKNGVTLEKQWIATLDKKTRRAHGELDGQRVPVKGKFKMDGHSADGPRLFKFPALDINCRCSTISVVNGIAPEVRRTKDGVVPFQSYNEWAESKGIKLAPKTPVKPKAPKKPKTPVTDWDSVFSNNMREAVGEDNYKAFIADLNKQKSNQITKMLEKYGKQVEFAPLQNGSAYAKVNKVFLSQADFDGYGGFKPLEVVYHELGHVIDHLGKGDLKRIVRFESKIGRKKEIIEYERQVFQASTSDKYGLKDTIRDDIWRYINGDLPRYESIGKKPRKKAEKEAWLALQDKILTESNANMDKFINDWRDKYKDKKHVLYSLSDILEGSRTDYRLNNSPFGSGHGRDYWKTDGMLETEFMAHMFETLMTNPESLAILKEVLPNSYKLFEQIMDDMTSAGFVEIVK